MALSARRRDRLDGLAATIRSDGGTALALQTDVTQQQQAIDAVERTVAGTRPCLDTLVRNAGVMLLGPALGAPTEEWDQMVALNVVTARTRSAWRRWRSRLTLPSPVSVSAG